MADNEQIRQQNEINRATGQGHDAAKRETAGMIKKLRKALEKQGFHKLDDGSLCFCEHRNPASLHEEHGEHCQLARKALAESEPQQQPLWSDAPDAGPSVGSVQTDADTLKPTVTIPLQLSPPEIARRIVAPWTVYGNVRIDGTVIERAIIAVIEEERERAKRMK